MQAYIERVFGAASHFLNVVLGGTIQHSLSARTGKAQHDGKAWARYAAAFINGLLFSHNHCLERAREEGLI